MRVLFKEWSVLFNRGRGLYSTIKSSKAIRCLAEMLGGGEEI
jgi:hypothetical protein